MASETSTRSRVSGLAVAGTGLLIGLAGVLAFAPPIREIRSEVEIESTPERVWEVLTDFESYSQWNPFLNPVMGEARAGTRLEVTFNTGGRSQAMRPTVLVADPHRELRWLGRLFVPRLFDGEHSFILEPLSDDRVRVVQQEKLTGLLVPFLGSLLENTERSFHEMNHALKARVEKVSA